VRVVILSFLLIIIVILVKFVIPSITCIPAEAEKVRSAVSGCYQKDEAGVAIVDFDILLGCDLTGIKFGGTYIASAIR
jgi:hypothetical protein